MKKISLKKDPPRVEIYDQYLNNYDLLHLNPSIKLANDGLYISSVLTTLMCQIYKFDS